MSYAENTMSCAEPPSTICDYRYLNDKWVLYNHLPSVKDWTINGYTKVMDNINTVEQVVALNKSISDEIIKYSMLFFMRKGITPLWEDERNKHGGCFSYKVSNKHVIHVWRHMMYKVAGETLGMDQEYSNAINGITISPKKNFCILKIWLKDNKHQDPQMISNIDNLTKHGSMFKRHGET